MQKELNKVTEAEEAYRLYLDENYGPMWGEEQEREIARLSENLRRAYEAADVHEFDRIAGV